MTTSSIIIERAVTIVTALLLSNLVFLPSSYDSIRADSVPEETEQPTPSHKVYFSLANEHGFPLQEEKQDFDCEDKIYAVVELSNFKQGKHNLSVVWTDPSDTDRERTQYDFHVRESKVRLWSWLILSRAKGAGMLQWINPAAGLEEFIGPWTVTVKVDNKEIEKKQLQVSC